MKTRICKLCGSEFIPSSSRQIYCNREVVKICKSCGREFKTICNPSSADYCSRACAGRSANDAIKICSICGTEFKPNSPRQKYCRRKVIKLCAVCGSEFESTCGDTRNTCSSDCSKIYAHDRSVESNMQETRICEWCGEKFHPVNNTQKYCNRMHYATCEVCGDHYPVDLSKQDVPRTCSTHCANQLRFINGNPFSDPVARMKSTNTMISKYGVDHPMHNPSILNKLKQTYESRTGYDHPMHNPSVRSRIIRSSRISSFENRVRILLDEYNIDHVDHYFLSSSKASHEFDFYLPKYKFLIDCDGLYYHSYLDDPDGKHVLDYYDEDRLSLIPSDHIFHVIVEGQEEKDIKYIVDIIDRMDSGVFDYEGEMFKWCRSITFPYPKYEDCRMIKDYQRLVNYHNSKYVPSCRLGDSIINNFHRSIYSAHVGKYVSPIEAWNDDKLLKKVIKNRLIYKNDVDPYKIMKGFNISKICPRVSIFNPVLSKYICETYLKDHHVVFDPFSGYSGRMLGVCASGKSYLGQDLNDVAVEESNSVIKFLNLTSASVRVMNVLNDSGEFDCLMTCPPYSDKEIYGNESEYKTCDEWISDLIDRYKCSRYIFVVDHTDRFLSDVVEEISSTSHFSKVKEYVVVIDR